jgi:hypothetical protein
LLLPSQNLACVWKGKQLEVEARMGMKDKFRKEDPDQRRSQRGDSFACNQSREGTSKVLSWGRHISKQECSSPAVSGARAWGTRSFIEAPSLRKPSSMENWGAVSVPSLLGVAFSFPRPTGHSWRSLQRKGLGAGLSQAGWSKTGARREEDQGEGNL